MNEHDEKPVEAENNNAAETTDPQAAEAPETEMDQMVGGRRRRTGAEISDISFTTRYDESTPKR